MQPPSPPPARKLGHLLASCAVFAAAFALLCLNARRYLPFVADDALISLRYAQRLIGGHGLTWTEGPRVEGYSNLLWVLGVAGLGAWHVDFIVAARALGYAAMAGTLVAVISLPTREGWRSLPAATAAAATIAACGWAAVWTIGGLEQPLMVLLLAWGLVLSSPLVEPAELDGLQTGWAATCLGLLCLARVDGALFVGAVLLALVLVRGLSRSTLRRGVALCWLPLLLCLGQLAFRRVYYGHWVPNTALVKVAFSSTRIRDGIEYVKQGAASSWPAIALTLAATIVGMVQPATRRRTAFMLLPLVAWTIYVVVIGGDIFPGRRHLVPVVVLSALIVAQSPLLRWKGPWARAVAALVGAAALLSWFTVLQRRDPENLRAVSERWEWDGEVLGRALKRAFPLQPLLAVDPAGCVPYWSELPAIDMLGLNDEYLPRHKPPGFGQGRIGHELGDGKYVLQRAPDLVLMCGPRGGGENGACFRSGRELLADPDFRARYVWVTLELNPNLSTGIWMRRDSRRLGVVHTADTMTLPAFFLRGTNARPGPQGTLIAALPPHASAQLATLALGAGRWRVTVEPPVPGLAVAVSSATGGAPVGGAGDTFSVFSDASVSVAVTSSSSAPADLISLTLERIGRAEVQE